MTTQSSFPELRLRLNEPLIQVEDASGLNSETVGDVWTLSGLQSEAWRLVRLAVPLSIQYLFAYTTLLVSTAFAGHLGSFSLSVAVLSTSIYNVLGASILIGFSSAIETLCGMAYGAKNYGKMGVLLQRALIITTGVFAVICVVWIGIGPLLRLAGQDPELASAAAKYLHLSMPALFFGGCCNCVLQRYLQSQGIVLPITLAIGIIALLAPCYMYFFMHMLDLGVYGAPIATGANNLSIALALLSITIWRERSLRGTERQMWHGWSRRALKGLVTYLSLAIPSTGMICLEWWSFEVVVLMAGNLQPNPEIAVAVMGVCMNLNAAVYMLPRGMSGAASTRVSNELGASRPKFAKQAAWTAIFLGGGSAGILAACCYLLRRPLISIFTSDPTVVDSDLKIFYIMCYTIFTDGVNVSIEGVIRGSGRQLLAAIVNAVTYWGLGIPTAWYFAFPLQLNVAGFWYSRALATTAQMLVMLFVLLFLYDWEWLAKMAVANIAAATPRVADEASRKVFARAVDEPTAQAASDLPSASSLAINIRRRHQEPNENDYDELSRTPQYSYTSYVTKGGSFAAR